MISWFAAGFACGAFLLWLSASRHKKDAAFWKNKSEWWRKELGWWVESNNRWKAEYYQASRRPLINWGHDANGNRIPFDDDPSIHAWHGTTKH